MESDEFRTVRVYTKKYTSKDKDGNTVEKESQQKQVSLKKEDPFEDNDLVKVLTQSDYGKLLDNQFSDAKLDELMIICGHYEGIDERVNSYVDELVSIGDYVLTGGEIPAMAIADSVIRLLDGAITAESLEDESFNDSALEYPQYTEPYEYEGQTVPDILYSGNHEAIAKWRRKQSLLLTRKHRPDLFAKLELSKQDKKLLAEAESGETPKWEKDALEKGHKFIKK